uniref:GCN5-related N-acetyltransferase Rv2170-like domain-containing protein n=1 Tax=Timema genevievae TaxID=629358 RepID=A0A7R9PHS3_TIMGE|nr:unnamed protein product [Timema genevievae]
MFVLFGEVLLTAIRGQSDNCSSNVLHVITPQFQSDQTESDHVLTPNGRTYESFCVFCPSGELDNLRQLEQEDVLVDWSSPIFLNFTHCAIMDRLEEFYQPIGTLEKVCGDVYVCCNPPLDFPLDDLPTEEAEMKQLKTEHAKTIHDLYPANTMECVEVFEKLISALPAYGTRPEFRRKGYGIHLAKFLTELVISRGYIPFVMIRPENDASQSLYTKLGFEKHYQTVRAIFETTRSGRRYARRRGKGGNGAGRDFGRLNLLRGGLCNTALLWPHTLATHRIPALALSSVLQDLK